MGYVEAFGIGEWTECDKCDKPTPKRDGVYEEIDCIKILFFCRECAK